MYWLGGLLAPSHLPWLAVYCVASFAVRCRLPCHVRGRADAAHPGRCQGEGVEGEDWAVHLGRVAWQKGGEFCMHEQAPIPPPHGEPSLSRGADRTTRGACWLPSLGASEILVRAWSKMIRVLWLQECTVELWRAGCAASLLLQKYGAEQAYPPCANDRRPVSQNFRLSPSARSRFTTTTIHQPMHSSCHRRPVR